MSCLCYDFIYRNVDDGDMEKYANGGCDEHN